LSERWLGEANHPLQAAVLRRLQDPDWMVRRQLAASLGALPVDTRVVAVTSLLEQYGDDAVTMDAAISGLAGIEAPVLQKMMLPPSVPTTGGQPARETPQPETPQRETPQRETPQRETPQRETPQREASITMLAATIVRSREDAVIQRMLAWIGDE